MALASLDLRRNKTLMAAITAAIAAYLEQETGTVPAAVAAAPAAPKIVVPEPSFWRVLKYMVFQR